MNNKMIHMAAFVLLVVGGLNWGLTAFGFNIVHMVLGSVPMLEDAVYVLVGLAAIYEAVTHKSNCRHCGVSAAAPAQSGQGQGM